MTFGSFVILTMNWLTVQFGDSWILWGITPSCGILGYIIRRNRAYTASELRGPWFLRLETFCDLLGRFHCLVVKGSEKRCEISSLLEFMCGVIVDRRFIVMMLRCWDTKNIQTVNCLCGVMWMDMRFVARAILKGHSVLLECTWSWGNYAVCAAVSCSHFAVNWYANAKQVRCECCVVYWSSVVCNVCTLAIFAML